MADGLVLYTADGLEELNQLLVYADARTKQVLAQALYEHMLNVMDQAIDLCPVDSGLLASSGHVSEPIVTDRGVFIELSFGQRPFVWYAQDQHENPTYRHAPGKSYKFLEKPLLEWSRHGPAEVVDDASGLL